MYTIIAYIKEFLENQYVADCKETLKWTLQCAEMIDMEEWGNKENGE
jgi:hypothetical protein